MGLAGVTTKRIPLVPFSLFLIGSLARLVLSLQPQSSPDAATWRLFAESILHHGLYETYTTYSSTPLFNHPPLAGLAAAGLLVVANTFSLPFSIALRLAASCADIATSLLLVLIGERLSLNRTNGWWLCACYSIGLCQIVISGVHGNTDPFYTFFLVACVGLIDLYRRPFWAGIAFACALNVKLIPLMFLPALVVVVRGGVGRAKFITGLLLGGLPLVVAIFAFGHAFTANVFGYSPAPGFLWGPQFLSVLTDNSVQAALDLAALSRFAVGIIALIVALLAMRRKGMSALDVATLVSCLFTVLSPVFALQYLLLPTSFVVLLSRRLGLLYSSCAGLMLVDIYWSLEQGGGATPVANVLSLCSWGTIVLATFRGAKGHIGPAVTGRDVDYRVSNSLGGGR